MMKEEISLKEEAKNLLDDRKTHKQLIRFSAREKSILDYWKGATGTPISEIIRRKVFEGQHILKSREEIEYLSRQNVELSKIGNNLNQSVKSLNSINKILKNFEQTVLQQQKPVSTDDEPLAKIINEIEVALKEIAEVKNEIDALKLINGDRLKKD